MSTVTVTDTTITLPTYMLGPEDPNPPLFRAGLWSIYPYTLLDDIRTERSERGFRAVILENEYVRVTILPELGGRIHSMFDKSSGREAFYANDAIKPGLVALRGAWLAGGIEWNYPGGHHCNTVSPVGCRVIENEDGSATCWVGALEHTTRIKWLVGIRLAPGRSCIETDVRIFNRTPLRGRMYFWENSAVYAPEDLTLVYPARHALLAGGGELVTYPVTQEGRDISLYRNHPSANDTFTLGVKESFFGAWYPSWDSGAVGIGDPRETPGKKFFTWGTAESGLVWADILSDACGPYCEVQGGRLTTQGIWEFIAAGVTEHWKQYWWPAHGTGGFDWANLDGAVKLRAEGCRLEIGVCVTRRIESATVEVLGGDETVWEWSGTLAPDASLCESVELATSAPSPASGGDAAASSSPTLPPVLSPAQDHPLSASGEGEGPQGPGGEVGLGARLGAPGSGLRIRVSEGAAVVVQYALGQEPRVDHAAVERWKRRTCPECDMTPQELCTAARTAEKQGNYPEAQRLYEKSLIGRTQNAAAMAGLAGLALRMGRWDHARNWAQAATEADPNATDAAYLLGLALRGLGRPDDAEDQLWRVMRDPQVEAPAAVALAELAIARGALEEGRALLRRSLEREHRNTRATALLAAVTRHLGDAEGAAGIVCEALLILDPTDSLLALESWLQDPNAASEELVLSCTRGLPNDYLESAWDYVSAGLVDDAICVLGLGMLHGLGAPEPLADEPARGVSPMLHYLRAYLLERTGRGEAASSALDAAEQCSSRCVFPHRAEELEVLRWACAERPEDAGAHLLLGNLEAHLGWRPEAIAAWRHAAGLDASLAVAHRNLGVAARAEDKLEAAVAHFHRAREADPSDYRYHRELDDLYRALRREPDERLAELEAAPEIVKSQQDVAWRRAALVTATGDYDAAIEVLATHTFRPWEGAVAMRQVYVEPLLCRGRARLAAGDLEGASADFEAAVKYPLNIGVGRLPKPQDAKVWWFVAQSRKALGDSDGARAALEAGAEETHPVSSEGRFYQIECLRALGRDTDAAEAAAAMLEAARAAAHSESDSGSAWLRLGLALLLHGQEAEARKQFARALDLDPQLVEARVRL